MSDRTTINVPKSEHMAAVEIKDDHGDTWADVLQFYATHKPRVNNDGLGRERDTDAAVDPEALAEQLQSHINYPEQQDTETIVQRLDDLETRLPAKVAQELQR